MSEVNKQLYENSLLSNSSVESAYDESEDVLFNSKRPNLAVLHEKPEHRIMLWLKAKGHSNREIAKIAGYSEPWVSQVLRQPWAREKISELIRNAGQDELQVLLQGAALDSVYKIIQLRDDDTVRPETQLCAAKDLADRFLGKATQRVETTSINLSAKDLELVDKELAEVNNELNRLTGNPQQN